MFNCAFSASKRTRAGICVPSAAPLLVALCADDDLVPAYERRMLNLSSCKIPRLASDESVLLAELAARGTQLALMTEASHGAARAVCARRGISPHILSDGEAEIKGSAHGAPVSRRARAARRAERLALLCCEKGVPLSRIAVVAVSPLDCAALMEAGWGIALWSAGYEACHAADVVFPARAEGGLRRALELILAA
ncbi:MAG: hypothetical protein E7001_08360 [Coriobacteriaceae bacterium]|nr:hypothetical protein [Coriobacteriaceae bacterium]